MGEYGWAIALAGFILTALGVYAGWVARIMKGESAADTAKKAQDTADSAVRELAAFKTEVARDYASAKMVEQVESRVVSAIDRLGDRLDNIVELVLANANRPAPRSAPRTRATKS